MQESIPSRNLRLFELNTPFSIMAIIMPSNQNRTRSLAKAFAKLKDRNRYVLVKGIVYKFKCRSCKCTYIRETDRVWHSRQLEHKPGTRKQLKSAIKEHAQSTGHNVTSTDAPFMEKVVFNLSKRKFLEAVHT